MFLPSGYRALVKRCNLLRGASGRERHSNPPALCSFDFYGLKLAMKPSKFHYKIFELHSLHNKTPFRKFWLSYTMFYPWNATVLRHRFATRVRFESVETFRRWHCHTQSATDSISRRPAPIGLVSLHFDFPFVRGDKSNRSHLCRMFGKYAIPDT